MDPKACLERLKNAAKINDYEEQQEAIEDLRGWLVKGGAMPEVDRLTMICLLTLAKYGAWAKEEFAANKSK